MWKVPSISGYVWYNVGSPYLRNMYIEHGATWDENVTLFTHLHGLYTLLNVHHVSFSIIIQPSSSLTIFGAYIDLKMYMPAWHVPPDLFLIFTIYWLC
jgi:hypothetical protein